MMYLAGMAERIADDLNAGEIDAGRYLFRNQSENAYVKASLLPKLLQHKKTRMLMPMIP